VTAFLGSQANASRASHVWRTRKKRRKTATRDEKVEDIWSIKKIKVSEGWHVKEWSEHYITQHNSSVRA